MGETEEKRIADEFHKVWYRRQYIYWMGQPVQKCPMDLWIFQEIVSECRPDVIVECGTGQGGSALFLANLCDLMQHGMVITVDNMRWVGLAPHPRIMYITGSSVDRKIVEQVKDLAGSFRNRMVILDSDHSKAHVLKELDFYGDLVTPRQYLIVEDTNIHGHPVRTDLPAGPWEALEKWLPEHPEFVRDETCERLLLTFNPGGYLRRMR